MGENKQQKKQSENGESVRVDAPVTCFCPKCKEESFEVTVANSGSGHSEWGTMHWFEGDGACSECGYKGYYSDTSM